MNKTNFDLYLEEQMRDPLFAARFEAACKEWDVKQQNILAPDLSLAEQTQACVRSDQDGGCEHERNIGDADAR